MWSDMGLGTSTRNDTSINHELSAKYLRDYLDETTQAILMGGEMPEDAQLPGHLWNGALGTAWTVLLVASALSSAEDELVSRKINYQTIRYLSGANQPFTSSSLFYGSSGFLFYLCDVVELTGDAQRLLENLASTWLHGLSEKNEAMTRIGWSDGIGGLLGIARRLARCDVLPDYLRENAHQVGLGFLRSLVSASQRGSPWFVTAKAMGQDPRSKHEWYVNGQFPVGVAHGAAGLLLNLTLSATQGLEIPNLDDAMDAIRSWIVEWALLEDGTFAGVVGAGSGGNPDLKRLIRVPNSWCNGSDGIASALNISLFHKPDPVLAKVVRRAFEVTKDEPIRSEYLSNGLCHGEPGLALLRGRMNTPDANSRTNEILSRIKPSITHSTFLFDGTSGTAQLALDVYSGQAGATELMLLS